jgi:ElaB/YqjD/DUF883 family membrane-anchored ribosome-binding protein
MSQKTVLQELIDSIDTIVKVLPDEAIGAKNQAIIIKSKAESLLEKEKQQLIAFGYSQIQQIDSELGDLIYKKVPEEIYNETFVPSL